jgi:hypothetical protein
MTALQVSLLRNFNPLIRMPHVRFKDRMNREADLIVAQEENLMVQEGSLGGKKQQQRSGAAVFFKI